MYQYPSGTSTNLANLNEGRYYHSCTHVYMGGTLVEIFLKTLKLSETLLNFLLGPSCHWRQE